MTLGSYVTYAEPRNESLMLKQSKDSGMFPKVGVSHHKLLAKQIEGVRKSMDINMVRERRIEQDQRLNHQLETDRLHEVLRQNRIPGLRSEMNMRMSADRIASEI
jgi:hypothetical protein